MIRLSHQVEFAQMTSVLTLWKRFRRAGALRARSTARPGWLWSA